MESLSEAYWNSLPEYRRKVFKDINFTAGWCRDWFNANGIPYTGRDIISMTQMLIDRQWEVENNGKITRIQPEEE